MSLSFHSVLNLDDFQKGYAIWMFGMWGVGIQIPRLAIRYGKSYPGIINFHSISLVLMGLLTIMLVLTQISFWSRISQRGGNQATQFGLSLALMTLIIIQFIVGFILRVQLFKSIPTEWLFFMKRFHHILGWITWLVGKIVATFIVQMRNSDVIFRAWLFSLAASAVALVMLQILYRAQSRSAMLSFPYRVKNKHARYHNEIFQKLLNNQTPIQYKSIGVRYVIVDNSMYYIDEDFMHPGGEYVINMLNGKQINTYLKGARPFGPSTPKHLHTKYVIKYLQHRLVGQLASQSLLASQKSGGDVADWRITNFMKSDYVGCHQVLFQTDGGLVRQYFSIQNFGKYVMMGCSSQQVLSKTQRPYFLCFSLSLFQRNCLQNLRNSYKYYYANGSFDQNKQQKKKDNEGMSNQLTFFIKQFKGGLFNKYLVKSPKQRLFNVNGPYGSGLKLKPNSKGYIMLIAIDIGVIAFADLINFLLQKTLFQLVSVKASSSSLMKINPKKLNYDCLSNLRVKLVGSFQNSQKFYLATLTKQLHYITNKYNLKTFDLVLHYASSQIQQKITMIHQGFGKDTLKQLIQKQQPDRIIYSGTTFTETILRKLQNEITIKNPIQYL